MVKSPKSYNLYPRKVLQIVKSWITLKIFLNGICVVVNIITETGQTGTPHFPAKRNAKRL